MLREEIINPRPERKTTALARMESGKCEFECFLCDQKVLANKTMWAIDQKSTGSYQSLCLDCAETVTKAESGNFIARMKFCTMLTPSKRKKIGLSS